MTNMTYAQAIDFVLEVLNENTFVGIEDDKSIAMEKLEALKAQLAKRGSSKSPTKTQKANEGIKAVIADVLAESGEKMTVTEMLSDERLSGYTNQKISALLRLMIKEGRVDKVIEGKKAYFFTISE